MQGIRWGIGIVIPTYQETNEQICDRLNSLEELDSWRAKHGLSMRVAIISDGNPNEINTGHLRTYTLDVIKKEHSGLSATLINGYQYLAGWKSAKPKAEKILRLDMNGPNPIDIIPPLYAALNQYDVAIGTFSSDERSNLERAYANEIQESLPDSFQVDPFFMGAAAFRYGTLRRLLQKERLREYTKDNEWGLDFLMGRLATEEYDTTVVDLGEIQHERRPDAKVEKMYNCYRNVLGIF